MAEEPTSDVSPRYLSEDEQITIADLLRAKKSLRAIARELGRDPATISREVRRDRDPRTGKYHPFKARRRAAVRRARSKEGEIRRDPELKQFIQQHLDRRWSLEQISQVLRAAFPDKPDRHLAHETIYQAIYLPHRGGLQRKAGVRRSGRRARRRRRRMDERATHFVDPGHSRRASRCLLRQRTAQRQFGHRWEPRTPARSTKARPPQRAVNVTAHDWRRELARGNHRHLAALSLARGRRQCHVHQVDAGPFSCG
ncbi:transposase [Streptomyces sp. NPDC051963]|uniref:transposase n=1 Tax=Streptomyces sp. NPDC051963 TaxID=3365678 RepID=UPI0037D93D66